MARSLMQFIFRKPVFPLLIESDDKLLSAYSLSELNKIADKANFKHKDSYTVVDSAGEGWVYHHDLDGISPLTIKKRWFKKELIELCNQFIKEDSGKFVGRSLTSKTLPRVIREIAEHCAAVEPV